MHTHARNRGALFAAIFDPVDFTRTPPVVLDEKGIKILLKNSRYFYPAYCGSMNFRVSSRIVGAGGSKVINSIRLTHRTVRRA